MGKDFNPVDVSAICRKIFVVRQVPVILDVDVAAFRIPGLIEET